jgi:hypothetical protein
MVRFDGTPLYPPRTSKTVTYPLSPDEQALYEAVTAYVEQNYRRTTIGNRSSVGLALTVIQRRLASSTWALLRSLERRRERLAADRKRLEEGLVTTEDLAAEQDRLPTRDLREEKTADEEVASPDGTEEAERFDALISGATSARTVAELDAELADLQGLIYLARATYDQQRESKFARFQELLADHPGTKILVFTEHRDTLDYLVSAWRARLHGPGRHHPRRHGVPRARAPDRAVPLRRMPVPVRHRRGRGRAEHAVLLAADQLGRSVESGPA